MANKFKALMKGFGTIFLYFFLALLGSLVFGKYKFSQNFIIATLSQIGIYSFLLIGLGIIYHKRLIKDIHEFKKEYIGLAIRNWLIGLCFMLISNNIINNILKDIPINETLNRNLLFTYPISSIITMSLIGPLVEEITFRLSFKDAFTKMFTFALFTGFLFGLAHIAKPELTELLYIIPYGSLGFFFAKSMYETDNVYTSFISHALHNSLCILIYFIWS